MSIGFSDVEWKPRFTGERRRPLTCDAAEILARHRVLFDVPVVADVDDGGVIGIAGPRDGALALARGLVCQAAALHGPADLRMAFLVAADSAGRSGSGPSGSPTPGTRPRFGTDDWWRPASETPPRSWRR